MSCFACGRTFHDECEIGCDECHPNLEPENAAPVAAPEGRSERSERVPTIQTKKKGSTAKDLKDAKSTGRKRAAVLYPLDKASPCEWRGRKNCGGGQRPIVGCIDGRQLHRHHGPVKDTTRNHEGNVHRICTRCHNHWHELNDLLYEERAFSLLPHDPVEATVEELAADELSWATGAMARKYELASSRNKRAKLDTVMEHDHGV